MTTAVEPNSDATEQPVQTLETEELQQHLADRASMWDDLFEAARRIKSAVAPLPVVPTGAGGVEDLSSIAAFTPDDDRSFLNWIMERAGYRAHGYGRNEKRMAELLNRPRRIRT